MKSTFVSTACLFLAIALTATAQTVFFDDFEDGADPVWGNEYGDWVAVDGVYTSTIQSNEPPTYTSVTSLPELTDFTIDLDINGVRDGGIFLRSHRCDNGRIEGVLLVVGGWGGMYNGCYWHIGDCNGHSPSLNAVDVPGLQGSDVHVRIEVEGDHYRAYLNDDDEPITTLETDACPSGRVALYEFFDQSFDNVAITAAITGTRNSELPERDQVVSIHPNPFNPQTTITFALERDEWATVGVFDLTGRRVDVLVEGLVTAGPHTLTWNGFDSQRHTMPSGTYIVRLETESGVEARKVSLIR